MRVGLIVSPYKISGLSRYALELSGSLPKQGLDIKIIEAKPTPLANRVSKWVTKLGPDLAAFWGTYPPYVPMGEDRIFHLTHAGLATCLYLADPARCVVTVHDIIHYIFRHDPEISTYQHAFHQWADALGLRALHRARAVIAISEYTKTTLVEHLRLDPEKIHVIYRSVNLDRFRPLEIPPDFWQRHELDPDLRYVLHLSSDEPRKNVPALIRAFAQVAREMPDVRLLKIGHSQYHEVRQRLERLVRELGLGEKVKFIDSVSEEDLPRFYNMAAVFVLPSLYEGFGLPALEAMACGCPVIGSRGTPIAEVMGEAGILTDPRDETALAEQMHTLLSKSDLQIFLSQQGIERATLYSSQKEAYLTKEIYDSFS